MTQHPSVTVCAMCGALIGDRDAHDSFHVRLADHDRHMISVVQQASGAISAIGDVVDLHGEIIREWD